MYFGGIEGGATHSNLVICDESGTVRGKSKGPGTNHWAIGIEECAKRVVKMVTAAKEDAGIPKDRPLDSLGLTLSGCAQDASNAELAAKVQEIDSYCAKAIYVATDTAGSLFTGAPNGGMVVIAGLRLTITHLMLMETMVYDGARLPRRNRFILDLKTPRLYFSGNRDSGNEFHNLAVRTMYVEANRLPVHALMAIRISIKFGTGSNALMRTPEGKLVGCGGWGHLLGDEGGAYWIAHKAVKTVFDDVDGLRPSPHPTHRVWEAVMEHFSVDNRDDLLPHAYKNFEKSMFAGLAKKISALAYEGDDLSRHIFAVAGSTLAAHMSAMAQRVSARKLRVVCVGSVWNSWEVLKPGILNELAARGCTTELELVRLRVSSAMGAAWLAAKHVNYVLPRDDSAFCQIFYTYTPIKHTPNGKENGTTCENGTLKQNGTCTSENGTLKENGKSRENGSLNGSSHSNGKINGINQFEETCGCSDWSNWS